MIKRRIAGLGIIVFMACTCTLQAQDEDQFDIDAAVKDVRGLINDNSKLDEAISGLESAIKQADAAEVDASKLQMLRSQIARKLMQKRKINEAMAQYLAGGEFFAERLEDASARAMTSQNIRSISPFAARTGMTDEFRELLVKATEGMQKQEAEGEVTIISRQVADLLGMQAQTIGDDSQDRGQLKQTIEAEMKRLQSHHDAHPTDEMATYALSSILSAASIIHRGDEAASNELDTMRRQLLSTALEENLESTMLASEYMSVMMTKIATTYRDDPEGAQAAIESAVELLEKANEEQDSRLASSISAIKRYESRIASALKVKEMIGKPAPELDAEAWVNNESEVSLKSLKGKVVLLDFWAVWCGPCIATFPHLREWREEFHDQGFEIVGITRYYNYEWDEENEKAKRVDKNENEVEADAEQDAVAKFMQSHKLEHPSIITPTGSKMQTEFGVTGIPHAVLIDRQGNVRTVKVGSGQANADALHKMIKELIEEK